MRSTTVVILLGKIETIQREKHLKGEGKQANVYSLTGQTIKYFKSYMKAQHCQPEGKNWRAPTLQYCQDWNMLQQPTLQQEATSFYRGNLYNNMQ